MTGFQTWLVLAVCAYFGRGMITMWFHPAVVTSGGSKNGFSMVSTELPKNMSNTAVGAIGSFVRGTSTPQVIYVVMPTSGGSSGNGSNQPVVTPTANLKGKQVYNAGYSYYNPELGGVNCHSANWDGSHCADTTSSGIRWSEYVGHGVALAPSWLAVLGYGSVIHILSPDVMVGDYTVIDMCCGCEAANWKDGGYRIDFLNLKQSLQWNYPIRFVVAEYVPSIQSQMLSDYARICSIGGTPTPTPTSTLSKKNNSVGTVTPTFNP